LYDTFYVNRKSIFAIIIYVIVRRRAAIDRPVSKLSNAENSIAAGEIIANPSAIAVLHDLVLVSP